MSKSAEEQPPMDAKHICVITGLSGAGKSTALRAFEDLHYFTVDGLPASLAPEVAAMMKRQPMRHFQGIAIGMDLRQENFHNEFKTSLLEMAALGLAPQIIFLEADDSDLIKRYASTRRPHPLERKGLGLEAAIAAERKTLAPLRDMADLVINSTGFSIHDLRRKIQKHGRKKGSNAHSLRINLLSFGFKYGIPQDADFVFDLRFLPNPYFVEELRPLSGQDKEVAEYIFNFTAAREYKLKLRELLSFVLPQMEAEGRARLTIALGCTGGRHRSVAMAEELALALRQADYPLMVEHRNLELG